MILTLTQKLIVGVMGTFVVGLLVACVMLYMQNKSLNEKVIMQSNQITLLNNAVKAKDIIIDQGEMSNKLADLLEVERRSTDDMREGIRRDMRTAVKELILNDQQIRAFFSSVWPDNVLHILHETRNRLFPGTIQGNPTQSPIKPHSVPGAGRK